MSISTEITRITNDRNTIRNKLINFGLADSTATLDDLATAIGAIENRGAPSAEVQEGAAYTILPGYYSGGSVAGVAGGGSYGLQSKTVTPTKSQQAIAPDSGYYGLSGVTVEAIPAAYQDVTSVTAVAANVLATKTFVPSGGTLTAGTMPNNGAVSATLDATTDNQTYTVPAGYHDGTGTVSITLETKTATPTTSTQTITPTTGKVLSSVTVNPIPSQYADVSDVTATAAGVLSGTSFVNASGALTAGTMTNNGAISGTIDGLTATSYSVAAGYTSGGTVSLTNDIENALAAI